jgi:hypothetical protein
MPYASCLLQIAAGSCRKVFGPGRSKRRLLNVYTASAAGKAVGHAAFAGIGIIIVV